MRPKKVPCRGCGELFPLTAPDQTVCKQSCAELAAVLEADEQMARQKLLRQYGEQIFVPPPPDPVFTAPLAKKPTVKRGTTGPSGKGGSKGVYRPKKIRTR